jgi:hypothetical protein
VREATDQAWEYQREPKWTALSVAEEQPTCAVAKMDYIVR